MHQVRTRTADEFELALKTASIAEMKRLGQIYRKSLSSCKTKADYVTLLCIKLSKENKQDALRRFLLAGRLSMTLFQLPEAIDPETLLSVDFKAATDTPQMVDVGTKDSLIEGLEHITWALLNGENTYLDRKLQLRVDGEAVLVSSFYDSDSKILQVRAGYATAKKIGRQWASLAGVSFDSEVSQLAITTSEDAEKFAAVLQGRIVKCRGERLESKGFGEVVAKRDARFCDDLKGTQDFNAFKDIHELTGEDIEFEYNGVTAKVGFGFTTRSVVFRNNVQEDVIQHVYESLKSFLMNSESDS